MALQTITAGTVVRSTALFENAVSGLPADPTEVTLSYIIGSAPAVNVEYGVGGIVHTVTDPENGTYYYDLDTTSWATASNVLCVAQWAGQGDIQVIGAMTFIVAPPAAVPTFA